MSLSYDLTKQEDVQKHIDYYTGLQASDTLDMGILIDQATSHHEARPPADDIIVRTFHEEQMLKLKERYLASKAKSKYYSEILGLLSISVMRIRCGWADPVSGCECEGVMIPHVDFVIAHIECNHRISIGRKQVGANATRAYCRIGACAAENDGKGFAMDEATARVHILTHYF